MTRRPRFLDPRFMLVAVACATVTVAQLPAQTAKPAAPKIGSTSRQRDAEVDSVVSVMMARQHIAGASVVVMENGRIIKSSSYGIANKATGDSVRRSTAFFIASITKALTSATVLSLAEAGVLKLTDSLGRFLPDLPKSWHAVSVEQLLSMTSGLPEIDKDAAFGLTFPDFRTAIDSAREKPVRGAPGVAFNYSGTDYTLLGQIVEAATKRSFADVVSGRIFAPLKLRSAVFGDWHDITAGRAEWYSTFVPPDKFTADPYVDRTDYPTYKRPAAGMFISAEDLARFINALHRGQVLGKAGLQAYWKPVTLSNGKRDPHVLGSWAEIDPVRQIVVHEGGARAAVVYSRRSGLIVVVLTNTQGGRPLQWIDHIWSRYSSVSIE